MIKMSPKIEKLIIKYITKSATASDLDTLSIWIENPENIKLFEDFVQTHYAIYYKMSNPDPKKTLEKLILKIRREKSFVYRLKNNPKYKYTAAAAVIIGIITSSYFFKDKKLNNAVENATIIVNTIKTGTDKATLTLEDGSQIVLEKGGSFETKNANSNGEQIVYDKNEPKDDSKIIYNYLTIPRGGQFSLKLADGTQVWLNSESQLKYPVSFISGKIREVELIYGEAYFDVSPSSEHMGAKFKVINKGQEVEVLGTEFNIKAYKDETNIYTTLVEGKVTIYHDNIKQNLLPNEQSNFDTNANSLTIKTVDVYNEISWKEGVFSFEEESLKDMMKVISRWYDVDIIFKNKSIKNEIFVGVLRKNQNIEEILTCIQNFGVIKNFKIEDKIVVLE